MRITVLVLTVIAIFALIFLAYRQNEPSVPNDVNASAKDYCISDSDCVPDSCCHPVGCVNAKSAPSCFGISCTMECVPNTLDCGQASCSCVNNKCLAVKK